MRLLTALLLVLALAAPAFAQPPTAPGAPTFPGSTSNRRTVTINVTGPGSVIGPGISCTGTVCTGTYIVGTTTVLHASRPSGVTFQGWVGACTGTGSCTLVMSQSQSVGVTFTFPGWVLQWNDNSTDETNFQLERRSPCASGTFVLLASPPSGNGATAQATDATAVFGTSYGYRIRAVNGFGQSTYSNTVCSP